MLLLQIEESILLHRVVAAVVVEHLLLVEQLLQEDQLPLLQHVVQVHLQLVAQVEVHLPLPHHVLLEGAVAEALVEAVEVLVDVDKQSIINHIKLITYFYYKMPRNYTVVFSRQFF